MSNTKTELTETIQLMHYYLSKLYGKDMAEQLLIKHEKTLFTKNGLAYSLGELSIPFFCLYYLQDIFRPKPDNDARKLAPFHLELWATLEDMVIKDEFDRLVLCLPRSHSKTTVITYALVIYLAVYKKSFYTIVQGKTDNDAQKFIFEVRTAFDYNKYLIDTFGKLINSKRYVANKNELHLANNCKIEALSSTTSLRGRKHLNKRPQYLVCDDIAGLDDCITEQAKQKKLETFLKDVTYAGDTPVFRDGKKIKPGTKYIVIGTVLAENDLISSLLRDRSYRHIFKRGILVDGFDTDEYFNSGLWRQFRDIYFDHKNQYAQIDANDFYLKNEKDMSFPLLWPDKYSCLDMALMYYSDPRSFKSEIMNDASRVGEKVFHQIKTIPAEEMEEKEYQRTILCCDPAVEVTDRNDYTALCVGSIDANSYRYIRKGIVERLKFDDYIDKVISLLLEYPDITYIWIEKNTYQGRDQAEIRKRIKEDDILSKRKITVDSTRQFKNKDAKIRSIAGKVDTGFIIFNEDDIDFYQMVLDYNEFARFDDAPDVLAEFDRLIDDGDYQEISKLNFIDLRQLF